MKKTGPTLKQAVTLLRMLDACKELGADNQQVSYTDRDASDASVERSGTLLRAAAGQHTSDPCTSLSLINAIDTTPEARLWRGKRKQVQLLNASKAKNAKAKRHCSNDEKDMVMLKVCLMRQSRLKFERISTLKRVTFSKHDDWNAVKRKIGASFDLNDIVDQSFIVVADAELEITSSIPTLGSYLALFPHGIGRTIFGLCVDESSSIDSTHTFRIYMEPAVALMANLLLYNVMQCENSKQQQLHSEHGNRGSTSQSNHSSNGESTQSKSHGFSVNSSHQGQSFTCPVIDLTCNESMPEKSDNVPLLVRKKQECNKGPPGKHNEILHYSPEEIRRATDDLNRAHLIGRGAFGNVYEANLRFTQVAIKVLKESGMTSDDFNQEIGLLSKYRHPHIVAIMGMCSEPPLRAIVMEKMEGGSLYSHLHEKCDIPLMATRIRILHETAQGLAYLHYSSPRSKPLIHLDVKSSNILLDSYMRAKVSDFGLAKYMPTPLADKSYVKVDSFRGTRAYAADEYMDGQLSPKLDVFSFGVVVVETYTGLLAYSSARDTKRLIDLIRDGLYDINEFISLRDNKITSTTIPDVEIQQIAKDSLAARHKRITMEKVLKLFQNVREKY